MANRNFDQFQYSLESKIVKLFGTFTIGSSGAIASQNCKGFTPTKTASKTGRYTISLQDRFPELKSCLVTLQGPDDSAFGTTCGFVSFIRAPTVNSATPQFYLQFAGATTSPADTDLPSGTIVLVEITLKNSSLNF